MSLTESGRKLRNKVIVFAVLALAVLGLKTAKDRGVGAKYYPTWMTQKLNTTGLGGTVNMTGTASRFVPLPSKTPANLDVPEVRFTPWAWNSQIGCLYSNGGPVTTKGSLMEKQGVKMVISRQDDNAQLAANLTLLAKHLHDGEAEPTEGTHLIGIMGDGSGAFLTPLNKELIRAFGPDYRAEIIGSCGYSRGEDKLMGPKEWKTNPQSLKGAVIAGVIGDGDWNIALRYMGDNNVPNNPDEKTYDPDAVNWVNTTSYTDAAAKFVSGYCEPRRIVHGGKPTKETKPDVCVQGAVTWTPGDVTMAKEKGGVVTVISTKEYANQMPQVLIGIHKWNQAHRQTVEKILAAFAEGGDQVLTFPKALDRAAEISQEIYQENGANAEYWKKYYVGVTEKDKTGQTVELGGSKANNLADAALVFGLAPGTSPKASRFHATYNLFGNLMAKMYPDKMPSLAPEDSILDLSYLKAVVFSAGEGGGAAEEKTYTSTDSVTDVVGRRAVNIEFATGSATPTTSGLRQLDELANELTISTLRVVISGHTDNVGNSTSNQTLSEQRAEAVKAYLERKSPANFPQGRISARGLGDAQPIADNSSAAGRQKNRRVEIVLGQ
jgi:OOP family OmpA-OmpF porin